MSRRPKISASPPAPSSVAPMAGPASGTMAFWDYDPGTGLIGHSDRIEYHPIVFARVNDALNLFHLVGENRHFRSGQRLSSPVRHTGTPGMACPKT